MIPAPLYTGVYYNLLLIPVIFVFIRTVLRSLQPITVHYSNYPSAFFLFLFVAFYMGFRPIEYGYLGDTLTYSEYYTGYETGQEIVGNTDWLFHQLMKWCSYFMSVHLFFLLVALVYIGCILKACKRLFPDNILLSFLVCLTALSFWSYGVNGIRNGVASSILLLTLTYYPNKIKLLTGSLIAVSLHASMSLPVLSGLLVLFFPRVKLYFGVWLACLTFSLFVSSYFMDYLVTLNVIDDRFAGYATNTNDIDLFSSTGFRWDFLLYSLPPIVLGYYVVIRRKFSDQMYNYLLNIYLLSNAFWVLVIEVAYSNRFAYLSWFMYPVLLIYPFLKFQLWRQQYGKAALCLMLNFGFTYFMWLIGKS